MRLLDALLPDAQRSDPPAPPWGGSWSSLAQIAQGYNIPLQTTLKGQKADPVGGDFTGLILGGLKANGVVFGLEMVRLRVFSQARFQFQTMDLGRPGKLFGTPDLAILEEPWTGGTTGDLLAVKLLDADFAGSSFTWRYGKELVRLRPDWVDIAYEDRMYDGRKVGCHKLGYLYHEGGRNTGGTPTYFPADQVCEFTPIPDPSRAFGGMSWLTPVIRELQADQAATTHKLKFFENAATPNLAVSLKDAVSPELLEQIMELHAQEHAGSENAYKTMWLTNGADVTVVGADLKELEFTATQGKGETRLAVAAGVHPTVAGLSEGLQGSSLNAGNFGQARRQMSDILLAQLWQNIAGSMQTIVKPPSGSRLWIDKRDIPFLQDDAIDAAAIQHQQSTTIRTLVDAGYEPESVVKAVEANDFSLLVHSGLYSVQLQKPISGEPAPATTP